MAVVNARLQKMSGILSVPVVVGNLCKDCFHSEDQSRIQKKCLFLISGLQQDDRLHDPLGRRLRHRLRRLTAGGYKEGGGRGGQEEEGKNVRNSFFRHSFAH